MFRALILAAATAAIPLAAPAENRPVPQADVAPRDRMTMHVNSLILPELLKPVPPVNALGLVLVAEQAAIAAGCPRYDLDAERFGAVMSRLLEPVSALAEAGRENLPLDVVMNSYSTVKGGALARAGYDLASFCAAADEIFEELSEQSSANPDAPLLVLARSG